MKLAFQYAMKVFSLNIVLVLLCSSIGLSQNYQPVSSVSEAYFTGFCPNYNNCIYALRIDSMENTGSDSVFYNYGVVEQGEWYEDTCFELADTTWIGHSMIIRDNQWAVFFNRSNDSIKIHFTAGLNQSWLLYEFSNSNFIEAIVTDIYLGDVLGISDSIKTLQLQVKDTNGNNIAHNINGKTIKLSREHGVIQWYNFRQFPQDTSSVLLVGKSNPELGMKNIGIAEIFDFEVGNIFHYETVQASGSSNDVWKYTKRKVTDKVISANNDTILYTYADSIEEHHVNWQDQTRDTLIYDKINVQKIVLSQNFPFNTLPYEPVFSSAYSLYGYSTMRYGSRASKTIYMPWIEYDMGDSCWYYTHTDPAEMWSRYGEGLGGPYYDRGNSYVIPPVQNYHWIIYYKKGNETWGTPVNINESNPEKSKLTVFPNPSYGQFNVLFNSNFTGDLKISNLSGQVVYRRILTHINSTTIETGKIPPGIYFLSLTNAKNGKIHTKKIIINP